MPFYGSFDRNSHSLHSHTDSPKKSLTPSLVPVPDYEASDKIHVKGRVGSATISPCGRDIAIASPDGLSIIDLDRPFSPPRKLSTHGMPWLVVDAQWSPFAARDYWVVSTANHHALVWNLNMKESVGAIEHTLQGHSRAITDINFSAHVPDSLATCSVDGTVHSWDLRRPKQPTMTFFDWFAGATQVKYSRQEQHVLASAHDRWLRIWDDRMTCEPVKSILAHNSKIYGIDWNRTKNDQLITCSLDKTIKFWDLAAKDYETPKHIIQTMFPVWRARHTPFGETGIMAIPQNEPGDMYLYDTPTERFIPGETREEKTEPIAVFAGHGNHKVKEFLWRAKGGIDDDRTDRREFSLVSWGEDNILRIQKPEASALEKVGWKTGSRIPDRLPVTRKGATYKTFTTVDDNTSRESRLVSTMNDLRPRGPDYNIGISGLSLGFNDLLRTKRKSMKARGNSMTVNSRKGLSKESSHIGWMKGVSLTKRKSHAGHYRDGMRRFSARDAVDEIDEEDGEEDEWVESELVREEVIRIGQELPKLNWEDMSFDDEGGTSVLTVSLQGPWGQKKEFIFFQVHIAVPPGYPEMAAPQFRIDSTIFMDATTKAELEHAIHDLAYQFQEHGKNSLHFIFSYLLGDVDFESSTRLFNNIHDLHDLADLGQDSSSDDGNGINDMDDNLTTRRASSTFMSQDLTTTTFSGLGLTLGTSTAAINQTSVPLDRRTCGARWSHDGQLICFFPTQEEKTRAIFMGAADAARDRKADPFSSGFGRMNFESPLRPRVSDFGTDSENEGSSEAELEVGSWSSSDSESTSMNKMSLWYQPSGRLQMAWSEAHSVRSSGGNTGTGAGTGAGRRRGGGRSKNVVVLYDFRALLPSKKKYAKYYRVYGEDVCRHNAEVAERYGRDYELRDVWIFCSLLLQKGIPLEQTVPLYNAGSGVPEDQVQHSPVLVVARQVAEKQRAADSNVLADPPLTTRVRWGTHSMARQFVDRLFEHFEAVGDVQMLALLSCIFVEPSLEDALDALAGPLLDVDMLKQPDAPLAVKAPGFLLPFFTSTEAFWNAKFNSSKPRLDRTQSSRNTYAAPTPARMSGTQFPEELYHGIAASEQFPSVMQSQVTSRAVSIGGTPPTRSSREYVSGHREGGGFYLGSDWTPPPPPSQAQSTTQSLSESPNTRGFWKNNANNVAAQISAHIHLPRAIATAISASPPSTRKPSGKDKSSLEAGSAEDVRVGVSGSSGGNVTWGPDTVMAGMSRVSESLSDDGMRRFDEADEVISRSWKYRLEIPIMVEISVEDQGIFDDELVTRPVPFLSPGRAHLYEVYRKGYAELLQAWNLPLQRLEVLKFNHLHTPPDHPVDPTTLIPPVRPAPAASLTLNIMGRCRIHETPLRPLNDTLLFTSPTTPLTGGAVGTCDRCNFLQTQLRCVYCLEPVVALYTACLSCNCVTHEACLAEWHAAGEELCPAGDDCNCVEEAANGQVESWMAMVTILGLRAGRRGTMYLGQGPMAPPVAQTQADRRDFGLPSVMLQGPGAGLGYAADDSWGVERKGRKSRASLGAHEGGWGRSVFRAGVQRDRGGGWREGQGVGREEGVIEEGEEGRGQ